MTEPALTWKDIPGFGGIYQVSECGQVRRIGAPDSLGRPRRERVLKPTDRGDGYMVVSLSRAAMARSYPVHQLVALAWIGDRPTGAVLNHKDGVKVNNRASNLEYCTPGENTRHAVLLGMHPSGERHGRSKLTRADVDAIRMRDQSIKAEAKRFGVHCSTIERIRGGQRWTR